MREIGTQNHTINADLVQWFFKKKRQNVLHSYSVSSFLMSGFGYMDKQEWFSKVETFCGVSKKTSYRWLEELKDNQLMVEKKGILYIKGKAKLKKELNIHSKRSISLTPEILKNKSNYKKVLVEQIGLILQARYRYAHKEIVRYGHSTKLKGGVENQNGIAFKKRDVGCSLSYLSLKTGLSKTQVARCLTSTRKVSNVVSKLNAGEFKSKYSRRYFISNPKMFYTYYKGVYIVKERLASVICADSLLSRSSL